MAPRTLRASLARMLTLAAVPALAAAIAPRRGARTALRTALQRPATRAWPVRHPRRMPVRAVASSTDGEQAVAVPDAFWKGHAHNLASMDEYRSMYERSVEDPFAFWSDIARGFHWETPFPEGSASWDFDSSKGDVSVDWFGGGRTNLCYNALDRWVERGEGDRPALLFEANDEGASDPLEPRACWTYAELLDEVCRLANVLRRYGVKKGDVVTIFMPMIPQAVVAMLACARIGAVHSVVFGGFSADALAARVEDAGSKVVVTADGVMRGAKVVELHAVAAKAAEIVARNGGAVERMVVLERLGAERLETKLGAGRDAWWASEVAGESASCEVEWVDAEDPLFLLYTSGSTGKPKGVEHHSGGYMVYAATTFKYIFDHQPGDVFFCTADVGWITGHSYVAYGPLLNGATQLVFEGVPTFPDNARLWRMVDKHKVSQLYTAPTAIRSLMRFGEEPLEGTSRASLKLLGSVGEPINPEAWRWYFDKVGGGRCPIVDTWWQTETGGIMITPLPVAGWPMKPGAATLPFFGVQPVLLDKDSNEELQGAAEGLLAVKAAWPSTIRGVRGDRKRLCDTYFPVGGYYMTGDGARRDEDGVYWITGRVDDVINVSGHRIGTAEVESALVLHPDVAEAAVVGFPHPIKGEGIYAFVTLREGVDGADDLRKDLVMQVRGEIGPFAAPDAVHWAPGLPKTRSGKIMRRVLRKIAALGKEVSDDDLGDTSTLADPGVVAQLIDGHGQ